MSPPPPALLTACQAATGASARQNRRPRYHAAFTSTLSPLGTPLRGQEEEDYVHGEGVGGEGEGEEGDGLEFVPSPRILRELETVRGQLTDALRALAVAFSKVGHCQGVYYDVL